MIRIEKDVPMPTEKRGRKALYNFKSMNTGDSFFVEGGHKKQVSILTASTRHKPKKFRTSLVTEKRKKGVRCWRVK